ncbi:MAG: hypothetical protein HOG95_08900 [Rhodospirillaceae bacterium]|nr:hypothetical protein [Rhodospirillaceae bacterium]
MGRISGVISAIVLSVFVGGCALPVSVTVASWALDGVSYIATNKSLTDHGISFLAGQDCAMHRIVTEMDIYALCYKYQDPQSNKTAVADASGTVKQQKSNNTLQGLDLMLLADLGGASERALVPIVRPADGEKTPTEPSIEEIANFETASGGEDQSDFENLKDPDDGKGFNIKGIWNFLKNLTS